MSHVITAELAPSLQHSRAAIMAELATVLRASEANVTNIELVIARTRISMQEISAEFGGTRELILAMVGELSDSMSASLTSRSTQLDLQHRLLEFGLCVADTHATSHLRSLYRIAVTESIRHTGLGRDFHEVGLGRLTQRLADFLRLAQAAGALGSGDPHLLASHFLSPLHDLAACPVAGSAYVRNVVDLFCRGIYRGRSLC